MKGIMENLERLLRSCLPDQEVDTLEFLGEGDFCRAFLLNGNLAVRVPRHHRADRALGREACVMGRIAVRLPLPVPAPTYVSCPGTATPSLSLHDYLPGEELTAERWRSFAKEPRRHLAEEVGRFLRVLHELDPGTVAPCGVERMDHASEAGRLVRRLEGLGKDGAGDGETYFPAELVHALAEALRASVDGGARWSYEPTILHADVSPGHVLVDPARVALAGVIDWGDVVIGDPARDFIFLYEDWGPEFLALALNGYEPRSPEEFLHRVHLRYLVDQLQWTLVALDHGRQADLRHGVAALEAALGDYRESGG